MSEDGCPTCGQTECPECEGSGMVWIDDVNDPVNGGYSAPCLDCDGGYV